MEPPFDSLIAWKGGLVMAWFAVLFGAERLLPAVVSSVGGLKGSDGRHRLARNLGLWLLNVGLSPLFVLPVSLWAVGQQFDWRPLWWSGWQGLVIDVVVLDFLIYWWHLANHRVGLLWRFHEVHHLDRTLDTTTAVRFHFGEVALSAMARAVAPIEEGVLLVDWGAVVDGYRSDMTRTFGVGSLPDKIAELYDIVLEAQQAAITACAPGKSCAEIDGIARGIIDRAGYGESFGHGLGHGLGLDIHEAPFFNQQSTDIVLEAGMVMTVEPGIYLPGVGGVRIEDDVLITDHGHRVLTSFPRDPSQAVLEPLGVGG